MSGKVFETTKQGLWEIGIGLVDADKDGGCIDNRTSVTVVASSADEAIAKARKKFKKNEYLYEVKHLYDIDVK